MSDPLSEYVIKVGNLVWVSRLSDDDRDRYVAFGADVKPVVSARSKSDK